MDKQSRNSFNQAINSLGRVSSIGRAELTKLQEAVKTLMLKMEQIPAPVKPVAVVPVVPVEPKPVPAPEVKAK